MSSVRSPDTETAEGESSNEARGGDDQTNLPSDELPNGPNLASHSSSASMDSFQRQQSSQQKQCWVCFATEEDDPDTAWVRPCRCRGSTMWVHQKCLQRWVDEKQRGNTFTAVACSSCGYVYTIVYPPANFALFILEKVDRMIAKICPLMTGGIIVVSLYWTAVTYGAVTVMQVMGAERGLQALERADPMLVLAGLPVIPIVLITIKMIRWEDRIVGWLRDRFLTGTDTRGRRFPVPPDAAVGGGAAQQAAANNQNNQAAVAQQQVIRGAAEATRILCGSLALPTIAVTVGKLVYGDSVEPHWKRAFYGAAIFLMVRGATKIYFKCHQIVRQKNRMILNYPPTPPSTPPREREADESGAAEDNEGPVNIQP